MKLKILNRWMLGVQFSREHHLSKTVEWKRVLRVQVWLGHGGTCFAMVLSKNNVFADLFFLEIPFFAKNHSTSVNLWRQETGEATMSLMKTQLSQDLPDHEFCPFLCRNSCEHYPGRLHIEGWCDCCVIVLRRPDFRESFLIKLLLSELKKKHGMNGKLMTGTCRSIPIPRQSY